jgi:hypothetical protein
VTGATTGVTERTEVGDVRSPTSALTCAVVKARSDTGHLSSMRWTMRIGIITPSTRFHSESRVTIWMSPSTGSAVIL